MRLAEGGHHVLVAAQHRLHVTRELTAGLGAFAGAGDRALLVDHVQHAALDRALDRSGGDVGRDAATTLLVELRLEHRARDAGLQRIGGVEAIDHRDRGLGERSQAALEHPATMRQRDHVRVLAGAPREQLRRIVHARATRELVARDACGRRIVE